MMRVYLSADMEGMAGIVAVEQCRPAHARWIEGREAMTREAVVVAEAALAAGATRVIVNDGHAGMDNLLYDRFPAGVDIVTGRVKPHGMMEGCDATCDAALLIGYHCRRGGDRRAVLDHTYAADALHINGVLVGELGMNALLAASLGVPVAMVAGDDATCDEARALLGDAVVTVETKKGLSRYAARSRPWPEVERELQAGVRRALDAVRSHGTQAWPGLAALRVEPPIAFALTCRDCVEADAVALMPGSERLDDHRVRWTGRDFAEAYRGFLAAQHLARSTLPPPG